LLRMLIALEELRQKVSRGRKKVSPAPMGETKMKKAISPLV